MNGITMLTLGFLLGLRHATDPDHVIAVTTIIARKKHLRSAVLVGLSWGIGHSVMIVGIGIAVILFHVRIPDRLQSVFEFTVALLLIVLGVLNLSGIMGRLVQRLTPRTGAPTVHLHGSEPLHIHSGPDTRHGVDIRSFIRTHGLFQLTRPFAVGLVHGLAGSAAVAILILGSIPDPLLGVSYLVIFGLGTIIGMMLITSLLGVPIIMSARNVTSFGRHAAWISGAVSLLFGVWLAYEIGIRNGLLTGS